MTRAELSLDKRIWTRLCPHCSRQHTLDNGRVWALCGLWKIIRDDLHDRGGVPEKSVLKMIRKRFGMPISGAH